MQDSDGSELKNGMRLKITKTVLRKQKYSGN
jgi:hypothetical protein